MVGMSEMKTVAVMAASMAGGMAASMAEVRADRKAAATVVTKADYSAELKAVRMVASTVS